MSVTCNDIGPKGMVALAKALPDSLLETLNLWGSRIGADGLAALADALPESKLKKLVLGYNDIGAIGDRTTVNASKFMATL